MLLSFLGHSKVKTSHFGIFLILILILILIYLSIILPKYLIILSHNHLSIEIEKSAFIDGYFKD